MRTTLLQKLIGCLVASFALLEPLQGAEIVPPGYRPRPAGVHALVGGRVVVSPGTVLPEATIIIRDGYIEAVGADVAVPTDARVWPMSGLTIYAGFIEPYFLPKNTNAPISNAATEPIRSHEATAGGVGFFGAPGDKTDRGDRGPGYEVGRINPDYRAALTYTPDAKDIEALREQGFTAALVAPRQGIIRGTSALVALADKNPNDLILKPDVFQHLALDTAGEEERAYPRSLMGVIAVLRQSFFDATHYARDQADWQRQPRGRKRPEFDPSLEALVPASEGKMRVVIEPGSVLMVDRAARVAQEVKLDPVIVSCGQEWRRPELAKATKVPFIVPLNFPQLPKLPGDDDWIQVSLDQLRVWDWAAENPALLRQQQLEIALTTYGLSNKKDFRKNLRLALERGLSETDALAALTTVPAKLCGVEQQLGTVETGKIANLTIVDGDGYFDAESKVRAVWVDGENHYVNFPKAGAKKESPDADSAETKEDKEAELKALRQQRLARSPLEGRGPLTNPPAIVINNATVWTCGPEGKLEDATLVVLGSKIVGCERSGSAINVPPNAFKIDGTGLHVTPGLIDAHSHTAILGGVNESTLPSSAMVRMGDVVNADTKNLYEQLAGGLTVANLLHGSANPIGGQNQVIKLRDGLSPEDLKFEGAPPGIKFALGENVKQSNWGDRNTTRLPQTRMGVPTFHGNRFAAAREYLAKWEEYATKGGLAPRRNLELEALGEILKGERLIHCHSYRQDEIIAFLRTMESFGVRVGVLQHVLEGYKVADEIAAHGAGASCFADWWAYKFEVYDAIPYNGSLMHERGVLVSFNSDSSDLARRLNTEAAKAVKFGGTPEIEALKFVTINPAKQLGIDARAGSLERGKDADFVIWSGPPLDSRSRCLQTWIDGKQYFDRALASDRASALAREREALIAKAKQMAKLAGGGDSSSGSDDNAFFNVALEHQFDAIDRGCLGEEGR